MSQAAKEAIKRQRDLWKEAFKAGDVDGIMSFYAKGEETVAFDIVPPLSFQGWEAYKADWRGFLALFDATPKVEVQDICITCSDEVAFIHGFVKLNASLKGRPFHLWMRATNGLRKIDGEWLVVHDHVSIPVDLETGQPGMNLVPPGEVGS